MILKVYNYTAGMVISNFIKAIEGFQGGFQSQCVAG